MKDGSLMALVAIEACLLALTSVSDVGCTSDADWQCMLSVDGDCAEECARSLAHFL